jgi:hypothetical protein
MRIIASTIIAVALMTVSAPAVSAQTSATRTTSIAGQSISARALVVKVPGIGKPNTRAVVVRRPDGAGSRDFILVDQSTTPIDLAKAVATLIHSRRMLGHKLRGEIRAEIAPAVRRTTRITSDERLAARDLQRLNRARLVNLPGIGSGRAVPITPAAVVPRTR